ncbi:MAG TPA: hypothetical protein VGR70_08160 [Stellaceae bacterium]|nr:hypothetical protein [Stellaceae bacterium]
MKLIMLPVLLSVAFIGFEHRGEIVDQYRAAYPSDPAKREALEQCAHIDQSFNRLDMIDRDKCYKAILARVPAAAAAPVVAAPGPSFAQNPSHLPGNDIRRQEANDHYRLAQIVGAASIVPPSYPAPRNKANP